MKKGMVKAILVIVFFGMVFADVMAQPVENRFMDTGVPISDHAVLVVHPDVGVYSVDGSMASWTSQGNIAFTNKEPRIPLPSGEHILAVRYFDQSISISVRQDGTYYNMNTTETEYINITHEFEKGRYYYLYPVIRGNNVTFQIVDETNSDKKDAKKRIAATVKVMKKAKYPSKDTKAMNVQKAANDAPTVLEGTWVLSDNPQFEYTFSGAMAQIAARGKMPSYRGIIELTDTTITINYTQHNGTGSWSDILLITQMTVYKYSFNSEGHLLLTRTGGKNDTATKNIEGISVESGVFIKK